MKIARAARHLIATRRANIHLARRSALAYIQRSGAWRQCRAPLHHNVFAGAVMPEPLSGGSFRVAQRNAKPTNPCAGICSTSRAPKAKFPIQIQNRVNGRIRAREVRVIMASTGEQLGVLKLSDAIRKAQELGLDLVEVAATANPPVCRIVDFGKFKYEASKQEKDKKNSGSKLKEIKFRVNCAEHDYETKLRHGEEFLDKGNKVRVHLQFRGREMAHQELGMALMERVKADLSGMAQVEMEPKLQGKSVTMTLAPLPAAKRKRRFAISDDLPSLEESDRADEADED